MEEEVEGGGGEEGAEEDGCYKQSCNRSLQELNLGESLHDFLVWKREIDIWEGVGLEGLYIYI